MEARFYTIINKHMFAPFEWGKNDCCRFVANIYGEYDGKDYLEGIPQYNSAYTGYRVMVKMGGLDEIVRRGGFSENADLKHIKRGDLVKCENALGIWDGEKGLFAGGATRPLSDIEKRYTRE